MRKLILNSFELSIVKYGNVGDVKVTKDIFEVTISIGPVGRPDAKPPVGFGNLGFKASVKERRALSLTR